MVRAVLEPPSKWKPTGDGVSGGGAVKAFQEGALAILGSAFTAVVTISGRA
jgi:hypothetical protein